MARESCNLGDDDAEILKSSSSSSSSTCLLLKPCQEKIMATVVKVSSLIDSKEVSRQPVFCGQRCLICRKRVGLTGFRCRCGDLFCGRHRYSDTHDCSFDYKTAGREEISKANPVIRAAKIIKI